jgi:hypothetical protein
MPKIHYIKDRSGNSYRVELRGDAGWLIRIFDGQRRVGYMNCTGDPPVLNVGDFRLEDDLPVRETTVAKLWRKFTGAPAPVLNYQNRGLGTSMFFLLSHLAKEAGYMRLEGWLSRVDVGPNPELPNWYRRRGFTVVENLDKNTAAVASIAKDL